MLGLSGTKQNGATEITEHILCMIDKKVRFYLNTIETLFKNIS